MWHSLKAAWHESLLYLSVSVFKFLLFILLVHLCNIIACSENFLPSTATFCLIMYYVQYSLNKKCFQVILMYSSFSRGLLSDLVVRSTCATEADSNDMTNVSILKKLGRTNLHLHTWN